MSQLMCRVDSVLSTTCDCVWYPSCSACSRKVMIIESPFECVHCGSLYWEWGFRLRLKIYDSTGFTTITCFASAFKNLFQYSQSQIRTMFLNSNGIRNDGPDSNLNYDPSCLSEEGYNLINNLLSGQPFMFKFKTKERHTSLNEILSSELEKTSLSVISIACVFKHQRLILNRVLESKTRFKNETCRKPKRARQDSFRSEPQSLFITRNEKQCSVRKGPASAAQCSYTLSIPKKRKIRI
uniref:Replication factor A C-terminal domain-containing protein n=1 Tax=Timspurckia oligopyrenoides TaxID=708627 RepID=A0A7S1ERF5_9RHOD|mmetsp:Transcript_1578/g.2827  ORF Transcript_1578/g.2827 Transcript_1578/m.2827 type:complete len:239 (+) Transcript_1578:129-845(+)